MKKLNSYQLMKICFSILKTARVFIVFSLIIFFNARLWAEDGITNCVTIKDIVASAKTRDVYLFHEISGKADADQKRLGIELTKILENSKSLNLNKCVAAYYLGEMHFSGAIDILATNITLQLDGSQIQMKYLIELDMLDNPSTDALVKIGNPSIPAVIRNLAESDDAKVRELSLQVLTRIDGDKDISQLRLQKALKVETDSQKQARLQVALKSLSEMK